MSVKPSTASLASKLSRNRKAESSKPVVAIKDPFNESADDFINEPPVKKVEKKKAEKVPSKKSASVYASTSLVPTEAFLKCPFCGKAFSAGQELKRYLNQG